MAKQDLEYHLAWRLHSCLFYKLGQDTSSLPGQDSYLPAQPSCYIPGSCQDQRNVICSKPVAARRAGDFAVSLGDRFVQLK